MLTKTPLQRLRSLVKSKGEGSHGGHIIGRTKSGKPIYASATAHPGYTKQDHLDAADKHFSLARRSMRAAQNKKDWAPGQSKDVLGWGHHSSTGRWHQRQAYSSPVAKSQHGEGSRGGKVIGHTRSGHPIYEHDGRLTFGASHAHWEGRHDVPHHEAIRGHEYTEHEGKANGRFANRPTRAVIPLIDGYTAHHHITEIEDTENGPKAFGEWKVHGPNGAPTPHVLDASFLHDAQGAADDHKDQITDLRIPHPHEVGYYPGYEHSPRQYADSMIDAGRGHLLNDEERSYPTP